MVRIERAEGPDALAEFVALHDSAYAARPARWRASSLHLPMLLGQTPLTKERELAPFVAREGGEVVARACAAIDQPYLAHWNDRVGHILMFEALPEAREGARAVLDAACAWLAERGMTAARNGFGLFDMPYNTDAYDVLPPSMLRQNPPQYHALIKQAGFETEQGFVDYAVEVTPGLIERWQSALEGGRRSGFEIVRLRAWPAEDRARELSEIWNECFASHFGWSPLGPEITSLFVAGESPALDTSVFALQDGRAVGFCFVIPDDPTHAAFAPGRVQRPAEKLNILAIGVRKPARGRGPQLRDGRRRLPRAGAPGLDARLLHAGARRQLGVAAHGRGPRRIAVRELCRLSPRAARRPRRLPMTELLALSLTDLAARLRERRASPVELMEAVLARIDATNGDLNAFVAMHPREKLLAEAKAAEARIARGEARPLEGIPLGVKDLFDAMGLPNTRGSLLFKDTIATRSSTEVERLEAAGAIVVGKTNAPEFGSGAITKNLVHGVTRSPWNLALTPGGSSGGAAAALAANVCPLVTASDGGGSIRIPASFVGACGLKVSFGRVPRGPLEHWVFDDSAVGGPLTKTVADAALVLDATAGPSPCDPNSLPHPGLSYVAALAEALPSGTRFGFSPDLGSAVVQSDIGAVVEDAAQAFEKLGHRLLPIAGGPPELGREWGLLGSFEMRAHLSTFLPLRRGEIGRSLLKSLELAEQVNAKAWGEMAKKRAQLNDWCAALFEGVDFLLTPTVPFDPPPAKGPFPSETEGRRQRAAGVAAFTIPFNWSWHPAVTVRAGLSRRGLPVGLQIVGPRHRDDLVLRAALAFERERPWHPHWPATWEALNA